MFDVHTGGDIRLNVFLGRADHKHHDLLDVTFIFLCSFSLIAYLAYFTVLKFRRVAREKAAFAQIQKLMSKKGKIKVDKLANTFQVQLVIQNFVEGKEGAVSLEQHFS